MVFKCLIFSGILLTIDPTVVVCGSVTRDDISKEYKLSTTYELPPDCNRIVSVVQNTEKDYIYLATQCYLQILDRNLSLLDSRVHSDGSDYGIRFMLNRRSDLILCMNDEDGTCELWNASPLDRAIGRRNRTMVIHGIRESSTVAWIDRGDLNGSDFINIAIPTTYEKPAAPKIPLVATRSLPKSNESQSNFLAYLEDMFGSPKSFLPPIPCVAVEIEPVYGFSTSRFNYFLKLHKNENGRAEAKLARTCKRSPTFRSYIELPVECHIGNNDDTSNDGELSSAYFTNDELYAVFTRATDTDVESFVCRYNISKIDQEFTKRRRECLLGQAETTELEWYQYNTCPSTAIPPSVFNISQLDDPDFCYELDTAHPLGGSTPIVATPLDNLEIKKHITAIRVIHTQDDREVFLLVDKEGFLHKISSSGVTEVIEFDVSNSILSQNGLILSNDETTLYATSSGKVMAISLTESWTTNIDEDDNMATDMDDDDGTNRDNGDKGGIATNEWILFAVIAAVVVIVFITTVFGLSYLFYKKCKS